MVVERLEACAWVQDPAEEIGRVRDELRRGDESWRRWLDELERGDAVVASMRVRVHVGLPDGTSRSVEAENHHLWLEVGTHLPVLEAQIQEISGKDLEALADRLRELGGRIAANDLATMYVHVELGDDLIAALRRADTGEIPPGPAARDGLGTETGRHVVR